jgi:outer membrane murein-binding lipoprotein Lpp
MRTILLSTLAAILVSVVFAGCSTTVKTDNGHAVTTGVHAG